MENLLCFWCLENLPVPHIERLHASKFIVNSPLLVLNISLVVFCEVLLVVSFPTKLVLSHSEFPCKSYLVFGLSSLAPGPARPGSFRRQTRPVQRGTELLYWRVFWRRARKFRRTARPSGLQSGSAGLTAELAGGLLLTAIFSPPINTPSSSLR
jgi:hypothetical protein